MFKDQIKDAYDFRPVREYLVSIDDKYHKNKYSIEKLVHTLNLQTECSVIMSESHINTLKSVKDSNYKSFIIEKCRYEYRRKRIIVSSIATIGTIFTFSLFWYTDYSNIYNIPKNWRN